MSKVAGFGEGITTDDEKDTVKSDSVENYEHKISILGVPIFKATKYHTIDSKRVGRE